MPITDALRTCLEVARVLDRLGVRYLVGGSLASSLHGIPRSTDDADLAAELREEQVRPFVAALEDRFYLDEERVRDAVRRRASFNLIELATMFKVDVFVLGDGPVERREIERRETFVLPEGGEEITVSSAEDTVLRKLHWYRQGREVSDRQWRDLLGVLEVQGSRLDRGYLAEGAEALGVSDLLERALEQASIRPD